MPAGSGQSGHVFRGGEVDVKTDGSEFTLTTFTHENFPTTGLTSQEFDADLSSTFHHNETPNAGPAPRTWWTCPPSSHRRR
ncbi:hypothetical protein [Actinokineospora spheciospongiae]|uniref:hypothetical protein n=1 Tax=Actinokineospora spheciospongiae TaxID=909613 RepID=UPI000D71AE8D|nr:hypothetical protein [Actinokineospora spheciospongiae]PWW62366.1 hypothetical protein DFQ13_105176 [Actinokineospora spheciospongiae]